jgi:hypothetical protein
MLKHILFYPLCEVWGYLSVHSRDIQESEMNLLCKEVISDDILQ